MSVVGVVHSVSLGLGTDDEADVAKQQPSANGATPQKKTADTGVGDTNVYVDTDDDGNAGSGSPVRRARGVGCFLLPSDEEQERLLEQGAKAQ